jgi:hypothetical protein
LAGAVPSPAQPRTARSAGLPEWLALVRAIAGLQQLLLRAKLGSCNCATGVADDGDLEQMGDLALIGKATPIGAGRQIIVGPMRGRSRAYRIEGNRNATLSLAFNQRCDMVAATALVGPGAPASLEPAVLAFLNSDRMLKWAEIALGL